MAETTAVDLAALAAKVQGLCPQSRAALLVGSAALSRRGPIGDYDVTALDPSVSLGKARRVDDRFDGLPLTISAYHPRYFDSVCQVPQLILPSLRDLRKFRDGLLLFDRDGEVEKTHRAIRELRVPSESLRPFVEAVQTEGSSSEDGQATTAQDRLLFYYRLENMLFGWFHSRVEYRFSKPKWLFDDLRQLPSESLQILVHGLAEELLATGSLEELGAHLGQAAISARVPQAVFYLEDAQKLLAVGQKAEAVPSLRMAAFTFCERWAFSKERPYGDLRAIEDLLPSLGDSVEAADQAIRSILLLDRPIESQHFELWKASRADFEAALDLP